MYFGEAQEVGVDRRKKVSQEGLETSACCGMLFILALLFFPCAVVGAFVTADDHDLTAFQSGGFFPEHPIGEAGPLCRRHDAAAKSIVPARRPMSSTCTCTTQRQRSSSVAVSMSTFSYDRREVDLFVRGITLIYFTILYIFGMSRYGHNAVILMISYAG